MSWKQLRQMEVRNATAARQAVAPPPAAREKTWPALQESLARYTLAADSRPLADVEQELANHLLSLIRSAETLGVDLFKATELAIDRRAAVARLL